MDNCIMSSFPKAYLMEVFSCMRALLLFKTQYGSAANNVFPRQVALFSTAEKVFEINSSESFFAEAIDKR